MALSASWQIVVCFSSSKRLESELGDFRILFFKTPESVNAIRKTITDP